MKDFILVTTNDIPEHLSKGERMNCTDIQLFFKKNSHFHSVRHIVFHYFALRSPSELPKENYTV